MSAQAEPSLSTHKLHLIVVHHGLWGYPSHLSYVEKKLKKKFGDQIEVLNYCGNAGSHTYDGVDTCGERVVGAVLARLSKEDAPRITHLSMIGYSLGGLVLRYAAGLLYAHGIFDATPITDLSSPPRVIPLHFISVATPHAGAFRRSDSRFNRFFNSGAALLASRSGTHMVLRDRDGDDPEFSRLNLDGSSDLTCAADGGPTGRPLLDLMSDPNFPFWQALSAFKTRTAFANTINDRLVNFTTSAIEPVNAYKKEGARWEVVDPKYPSIVHLVDENGEEKNDDEREAGTGDEALAQEGEALAEVAEMVGSTEHGVSQDGLTKLAKAVFNGNGANPKPNASGTTKPSPDAQQKRDPRLYARLLLLPLIIPIGLAVVSVFTALAHARYKFGGGEAKRKKRVALIANAVKKRRVEAVDAAGRGSSSESGSLLETNERAASKSAATKSSGETSSFSQLSKLEAATSGDALVEIRKQIIARLNSLEWTKVHVRISHGRSHAAIVVRYPGFEDVMDYLVDHFDVSP